MYRALVFLVGLLLTLGACTTQRMICPAYQSAFIHDPAALSKRVSYFENDSTPKVVLTVSKNKYLIIPDQSYRKKIRSMQTVPMKSIQAIVPDSLQDKKTDSTSTVIVGAEQDSTSAAAPDSLKTNVPVDSTYMISVDKEVRVLKYRMDSMKYYIENVMYTADQDNYMWYFRDVLVLPDVRAALEQKGKDGKGDGAAGAEGVAPEKKGGFFKNLFKKKDKSDTLSATTPASDVDPSATPAPRKKKAGLFKRKSEPVEQAPEKKPDPAKKEDDGF